MKKRRIYKKKNNLHFIIHYMYTFKKKMHVTDRKM